MSPLEHGCCVPQGPTHAEQQTTLSEAAVQHLLGNTVDAGMAWAGAAHWRYRTRSSAKPAAAGGDAAAEDAPASKPAVRYTFYCFLRSYSNQSQVYTAIRLTESKNCNTCIGILVWQDPLW